MTRFWTRIAALVVLLVVSAVAVRGATDGATNASVVVTSLGTLASGEPAAAAGPDGPVPLRVYVIVLDGLMPQEVRAELTPNLTQLKEAGTWYEEARGVFPAETIPNHAAMMTGVLPQRSGIIGNDYWAPGSDGIPKSRMAHPKLLGVDTLTTRLETRCQISTATVQSKGYLWGVFRGEPPKDDTPPIGYNDFPGDTNRAHPGQQLEADFHWKPMGQPGYIGDPDDHAVDQTTMSRVFLPWLEEDHPVPQFAFVNLGDIDRSGHVDASGNAGGISAFRQAALADTDVLVGDLVDTLKGTGAWEETVLIFTSDHGMDWSVADNGANQAATVVSVNVTQELQDAGYTRDYEGDPGKNVLENPDTIGDFAVVPGGGTASVYVEEDEDVEPIAKLLSEHPGVAFVATRTRVPGVANNPTLGEMGMDHPVNGDIVLGVKPGSAVRDSASHNPLPGNHGHPATQNSVLMVAGGHPVLDEAPESVEGERVYDPNKKLFSPPAGGPGNLSVAPTVAALFGIGEPDGGYDRGPLTEAFDAWALQPHEPCSAATPPRASQEEQQQRASAGDGGGTIPAPDSGTQSQQVSAPRGASRRATALSTNTLSATSALRRLGLRRLLRLGRVSFRAVADGGGVLVLDVRARRGRRTVTVARGSKVFRQAGAATMTLRLTRAGRRLLRRAPRVALVVRARFLAGGVSSRRVTVLR